jgi:hypothetical protein
MSRMLCLSLMLLFAVSARAADQGAMPEAVGSAGTGVAQESALNDEVVPAAEAAAQEQYFVDLLLYKEGKPYLSHAVIIREGFEATYTLSGERMATGAGAAPAAGDGIVHVRNVRWQHSTQPRPLPAQAAKLSQAERFMLGDIELLLYLPGYDCFRAEVTRYPGAARAATDRSRPRFKQFLSSGRRLGWISGSLNVNQAVEPAPQQN